MNNSKKLDLLAAVFALLSISLTVNANEGVNLRQSTIHLTDRKITEQVVMDFTLDKPSTFTVTVSELGRGAGKDTNYFYLKPRKGMSKDRVKVHIDFPSQHRTPSGPYRVETFNTVQHGVSVHSTSHYNLCPNNDGKVCKPFSFIVIDEGAIPGIRYEAMLNMQVTNSSGHSFNEQVTVSYRNTLSSIGIYSPNDRFDLTARNQFTSENSFCVYSRGLPRLFDVRLEGQNSDNEFLLHGQNNETVAYKAQVHGNLSSYHAIDPLEWRFAGLSKWLSRNFESCGSYRNLWVKLQIPQSEVMATAAGRYTGTLTVRVRAR
ncbi:hypothetical protein [Parendozoicomonas haliclonae]|uniref:Uncharacterized protein n=1 Tax=Parendozoicomonas haliclonae TaxID=1960125 RepID=A0A1X7AJR5_9GAMM|nr:hypothetical protein [Parendozoicomonas haliclonae]SMA45923.1 hypothetical protein EHSB41UT_02038 [Parendozoicomonas haliclonae]